MWTLSGQWADMFAGAGFSGQTWPRRFWYFGVAAAERATLSLQPGLVASGALMKLTSVAFVFAVSLLAFASSLFAGPIEDFYAVRSALQNNDYTTALRLLRSLETRKFAAAKYMLGTMYFSGVGVPKDYPAAFKLHLEGAEQGHALAQYEVGAMYDRGVGVGQTQAEAMRWFRRSAEQGYGSAQVNLGAMYATGEGTQQDYVEAYKWFSIAAKGGGYMDNDGVRADAAKRVNAIASRMSSMQIAEGQARARQWQARPEPLVPR
jgi:hypothetical protein